MTPVLEGEWVRSSLEDVAISHGVTLARQHLVEVRRRTLDRVDRVAEAIRSRLLTEIRYWDHRAAELRDREHAGRLPASGMNSANARQRADELKIRLRNRLGELDAERQLSSAPPVVAGGALVIPAGLLARLVGRTASAVDATSQASAVQAVLDTERSLGRDPVRLPREGQGYDIESRSPEGTPMFITVKCRTSVGGFAVTQSEIGVARNTGNRHVLALVNGRHVRYVRRALSGVSDPPFGEPSIALPWRTYFEGGQEPR